MIFLCTKETYIVIDNIIYRLSKTDNLFQILSNREFILVAVSIFILLIYYSLFYTNNNYVELIRFGRRDKRAMSGMIFQDSGEVIINEINITKEKKVYDNIGVLIENAGFIDYLDGYKNLKILANIKKVITDNEIKDWMLKFNLDPNNNTKVRGYSLDMRQKIGIIQALMKKPEVIFLDEPINALDEETVKIFNKEIKKIKLEDKIVVISNHNYEELKGVCDEIIEIDNGTIKRIYSV